MRIQKRRKIHKERFWRSLIEIQSFFQHGYTDGYAHGRIHGLIEGRAAGKEKGMALWEEVGYYQGFAMLLKAAYANNDGSSYVFMFACCDCTHILYFCNRLASRRASHHITSLLSAIDRFPSVNPKPKTEAEAESQATTPGDELDVSKLLSQIRSRYKALCSVLSVPLRLRSVATGQGPLPSGDLTPESYIQAIMTTPSKSTTMWPVERQSPIDSTLGL